MSSAAAGFGAPPAAARAPSSADSAAPGAPAGSVFVKRAGDARARFAPVEILVGDAVGHLAKRASLERGWGVDAAYVDLFLVKPGGDRDFATPTQAQIDAVLADEGKLLGEGVPLSLAGIASGAWVVARLADAPAEAAAPFGRLVEALRAARAERVEGSASGASLVTLPAGAEWPQLGPGAPLFVRSFYEGCFEGVLRSFDAERAPDAPRKFTIIGNAGIGKSAFGAYLLWRAVQARRTVIYVSDKVKDAFVLHGDGRVEAFVSSEFLPRASSILDDASTVLICDGVKPPVCSAFTVLITSPVRERWKSFDECVDARRLFFPVFSSAEIEDMRRTCFPQLSGAEAEVGVQQRYEKWGGIPRYVLGKLDKDSQAELESAVALVNIDELFGKLGARQLSPTTAPLTAFCTLRPRERLPPAAAHFQTQATQPRTFSPAPSWARPTSSGLSSTLSRRRISGALTSCWRECPRALRPPDSSATSSSLRRCRRSSPAASSIAASSPRAARTARLRCPRASRPSLRPRRSSPG